jgi:DNA-binding response OmpR family regulator
MVMSGPAEGAIRAASPPSTPAPGRTDARLPLGISAVDERTGGLELGGSYLVLGAPGPAKMVAALQFVHAGIARAEPGLLLTNADAVGILAVSRAWGLDLEPAWKEGLLRILGFKDDFELRAIRSVEPQEVVEELDLMAGPDLARIAVDPGSLFLAGGARSLLGSTYLGWARRHPATVLTTFSVDGGAAALPSSADWLVHATTGQLVVESRADELYEISQVRAVPHPTDSDQPITVQLKPGAGLVVPEGFPTRRGRDRPGTDEGRLLMISLGGTHAADVETWAKASFTADIVSEPFEAVARAQSDPTFGGILIHAPRARIREAVQACRALRPLTRAAIVFASDDAVRSTDRINVLEAGADDCLSGGIDFRELDLRIRQAITSGSNPLPDGGAGGEGVASAPILEGAHGGRVSLDHLRVEIARRARDPVQRFFCVLDVASEAFEADRLEQLLALQVRAEEGDLVSTSGVGCAVLLQGAREAQLGAFLERLHARLEEAANGGGTRPVAAVTVLSHPADADRISTLLGTTNGPEG